MTNFMSNFFSHIAHIFTVVVTPLLCSLSFALEPFQANYQVDYNNKPLGVATSVLEHANDNAWQYSFSANAGDFIQASSVSLFHVEDGDIKPLSYNRNTKLFFFNNNNDVTFDQENKQITAKDNKTSHNYPLEDHVYDELNAELQVREDLKNQQLKDEYLIASTKGIKSLQLIQGGNETITTNAGTFETLKVTMKHDDIDRQTTFWLAPSLDYIPVKVLHVDDRLSYGLLLNSYQKAKTD